MTKILVYLKDPELSAMRFDRLSELGEDIDVVLASCRDDVEAGVDEIDVLITIGPHLGPDAASIYKKLPHLEWAQSIGAGVDNIKGHPGLPPSTVVTNVRGVHGPQLSEAAFSAMLSFSRELRLQFENQAQRLWNKMPVKLLTGRCVAIIGVGAIAGDLASRCRAFGMSVIGVSSTARDAPGFERVYGREQLNEAVSRADYVVILTPYSPATHHMIDGPVLAAMKPEAHLINLARGGVVDEQALLAALDGGDIAGAAMDVFETEPLPANSRFWSHPKVIVTPHAAGFHADYPEQAFAFISRNLRNYLAGGVDALENKV